MQCAKTYNSLRFLRLVFETGICALALLASRSTARCEPPQTDVDEKYQKERENLLKPLSREAGKSIEGLVFEARLAEGPAVAGKDINLTLSIRNVGRTTLQFRDEEIIAEEAWVHDENGRPAKLGREGIRLYGQRWSNEGAMGHMFILRLHPGCAAGFCFRLSDNFVLDRAGKYTVLVKKLFGFMGNRQIWFIAKPVVVNVGEGSSRANSYGEVEQRKAPPPSTVPNEPKDKDWAELAAKSGHCFEGCVLEAFDSPVISGNGNLIVSLMCEKYVGGNNEPHAELRLFRERLSGTRSRRGWSCGVGAKAASKRVRRQIEGAGKRCLS